MLVPVGTQIVCRVPTTADGRTHPPGSVGVVIETPTDPHHGYHLRLLDGTELRLVRDQFEVLREHQRDPFRPAFDALADHALERCIILRSIVGSRAYGLDHTGSDVDLRGVYLPPADLHWSLASVPEQLENSERDEVFWELRKFLILALKSNPNILEVLYTPRIETSTPLGDELRDLRPKLVSRLAFQTFGGYVDSQFRRMVARRAKGLEPKRKHAMHLLRLLHAGTALLRSGELPVVVEDPVVRDRLIAVRDGEAEFDSIEQWRLSMLREFEQACTATPLPERPDYDAANAFLIRARRAALVQNP